MSVYMRKAIMKFGFHINPVQTDLGLKGGDENQ